MLTLLEAISNCSVVTIAVSCNMTYICTPYLSLLHENCPTTSHYTILYTLSYVHCKKFGVYCTPKGLHTYGVLAHYTREGVLFTLTCIYGMVECLYDLVCPTHYSGTSLSKGYPRSKDTSKKPPKYCVAYISAPAIRTPLHSQDTFF